MDNVPPTQDITDNGHDESRRNDHQGNECGEMDKSEALDFGSHAWLSGDTRPASGITLRDSMLHAVLERKRILFEGKKWRAICHLERDGTAAMARQHARKLIRASADRESKIQGSMIGIYCESGVRYADRVASEGVEMLIGLSSD